MGSVTVEALDGPLDVSMRLPGSKSLTNRAMVCAALAAGPSVLRGALHADDTMAMFDGLRALGVDASASTVDGVGNVTIDIRGVAGRLGGGFVDAKLSGTTSRFLLAASLAAAAEVTVTGDAPLRARPMRDIVDALGSLGATISGDNPGFLPTTIVPPTSCGHQVEISGAASSQFLSGLLLVAPTLPAGLRIDVAGVLRSEPYVDMTIAVMESFGARVQVSDDRRTFIVEAGGYTGCEYAIEPDASTASYFLAAAAISGGRVEVPGLGAKSLQGDVAFARVLEQMGAGVTVGGEAVEVVGGPLRGLDIDMAPISDTAQTAAVVAVYAEGPTTIDGIGFIRRKETDRIGAVVTELRRCGIDAVERDDGFRIIPGATHPAAIHTYDDHRMAMAFSLIGLRSGGIEILDAECVSKTVPNYWTLLDNLRNNRS